MEYKDIPQFILQTKNRYEEERGIKTLRVRETSKSDRVTYFEADKSDGTSTLFVAIRLKGIRAPQANPDYSWRVFCPDQGMASDLKQFPQIYDNLQNRNQLSREALAK